MPTYFVEPKATDAIGELKDFFDRYPRSREFVVKPSVGAYSRDVLRFTRDQLWDEEKHVAALHRLGAVALIQPYLGSIEVLGETDLIFFNGSFSHAIRKGALLDADGTVNAPTANFRQSRMPGDDEIALATDALIATGKIVSEISELLYARVDLVKDDAGNPILLEMEISEPLLSLPFCEGSADRFAQAISERFKAYQRLELISV
ncbi:hypothetical protein [Breoghania sp.]|uniref:hypothetical protein n=1 Tax=Breoghania sp. TaxID=2065378 RepID=UPI00261B6448|nr:hypothetical protein [Breoghania sp.]